nr:hypothetical protein [Tanacetum cinerariifolium]
FLLLLFNSRANFWQWHLFSSGSGNNLHWHWELILPVGTLTCQWECLVHFIPNIKNVNNKVSKFLMYPRVKAQAHQLSPITHPHLRLNTHHILLILHQHFHLLPLPLFPLLPPSDTPTLRQYTIRARIAQSLALPPVADKPTSPLRDVSKGEACPTDSCFGADQDRANIAKTSTLSYDSTPRITSPAADEGSLQLKLDELTGLCTSMQRQHLEMIAKFEAQELEINRLKARVKLIENREGVAAERSGDDAPIKGRSLDEGEASAERVSDDTAEMATVLTSMDATTVLASGVAKVPTSSGSIPTAGPHAAEVPTGSDVVPTAGPMFATATVMARQLEEEMQRDAQRMNEQIARDAEIARIYAEEELQIMIDRLDRSNETIAKYLQEYHQFATELPLERRIELINDLIKYQDNYAKVHKFQTQQRKPWSKKQKRDYYMAVIKSNLSWKVKDFRGTTFKEIEAKFTTESVKKLKTSEKVPEEVKIPDEVPEEKVKEIMQLVPIEEVYVEAHQVKHLIIDWKVELKRLYEPDDEDQLWTHTQNLMHALVEWKLYDTCGVHYVIAKDKEIFMLVEKDYPLRKGLAIVMICYKLHVENYSKMANDLILKIHKIFSRPSQQDD